MEVDLRRIMVCFPTLSTVLIESCRTETVADKRLFLLDPLKAVIGTAKQQFSGGLELNENGKWFRSNITKPQYVGIPNEAIDDAWHDLLAGKGIQDVSKPKF